MSLSCTCEADDPDWWYEPDKDFSVLRTKRIRKCCSCRAKIKPGQEVLEFRRWRSPSESFDFLEEKIYGDEVPLAPWFMCETCGGLHFAVADLGMCYDICEDIAKQIKEFREAEDDHKRRYSKTNI